MATTARYGTERAGSGTGAGATPPPTASLPLSSVLARAADCCTAAAAAASPDTSCFPITTPRDKGRDTVAVLVPRRSGSRRGSLRPPRRPTAPPPSDTPALLLRLGWLACHGSRRAEPGPHSHGRRRGGQCCAFVEFAAPAPASATRPPSRPGLEGNQAAPPAAASCSGTAQSSQGGGRFPAPPEPA